MQNIRAAANVYGFYSLTLSPWVYVAEARYIGYNTLETTVDLNQDLSLDFNMATVPTHIREVVISAEKTNKNVQQTQMGVISVAVKSVKQLPALLGEAD